MTTDRPPGSTATAGRGRGRRPRRRHAATGGRILAAGISAGATLGLVAAMSSPPRAAEPVTTTDPPVVVVRRTDGQATGTAAPAVAPTDAAPVTTSQAS